MCHILKPSLLWPRAVALRIFVNDSSTDKLKTLSVNWWRGRLRPYESWLSFQVGFCALNSIRPEAFSHYSKFSDLEFSNNFDLFQHFASSIGELVSTVEPVCNGLPNIFGGSNSYSFFSNSRPSKSLQYCPICVAYGYHSSLHDLNWLKLCPFHIVPLKTSYSISSGFDALKKLYLESCQSWPYIDNTDSLSPHVETNDYAKLLVAWINAVKPKVEKYRDEKIWQDPIWEEPGFENIEYIFGKICSFEKLPDLLVPLVINFPCVSLKIKTFPLNFSLNILEVFGKGRFKDLYYLFKFIVAHSDQTASFYENLSKQKNRIRKLHKGCCEWFFEPANWSFHWRSVLPENYLSCKKCPYNFALDTLEYLWGKSEETMSSRRSYELELSFKYKANLYLGMNLYSVKDFTISNPIDEKLFSLYEWQDSASGKFFNSLAEYELDVYFAQTTRWLSDIENGAAPGDKKQVLGCVSVVNEGGRIKIFKWLQVDTDVSSTA